MKHTTVVRLLYSVAMVLSLLSWFPEFIWMSYEGAWEWNSMDLYWLAHGYGTVLGGHSLRLGAVGAVVCGSLPFFTGLLGILCTRSNILLAVSITTTAIVIIFVIVIYRSMVALYGQNHTPMIDPGAGTYLVGTILLIEIGAGIISSRKSTAIK
jgi:hypothetical protein